jgi:hypothetical protein
MEWPVTAGAMTIETTIVRSSGAAYRYAPGADKNNRHDSYAIVGANYYRGYFHLVTAPASTRAIFGVNNSASLKLAVRMTSARLLQLFNEEDGTQIGSNSAAVNLDEFYRLELKIDDTTLSATTVEARLYAASAEDTLLWNPSGTADLTAAPNRFIVSNRDDANLDIIWTDLCLINGDGTAPNTWAGEGSIVYLRPDGDGTLVDWARGGTDSGADWSQVEETTPNDATDYIESNTAGQIDDFTLGATPAAVLSDDVINWVAPGVRFAISSATGADPDGVMRITAGGNTEEGTAFSGAGNIAYVSYQTSPLANFTLVLVDMPGASTAAFTKADLDATQIGVRETVSDTHFIRVSAVWLMFEHKPAGAAPATKPYYYNMITEAQAGT